MDIYSKIEVEKLSDEKATKQKKSIFGFLYIAMLILGILSSFPIENKYITDAYEYLMYPLIFACAYGWCDIDAKNKGKILNPFWGLWFILFLPISLPIYLIIDKGLKVGLIYSIKAYLILFLSCLCFILGGGTTSLVLTT